MEKKWKAVRIEEDAHIKVHIKAIRWGKKVQQVWCALANHIDKLSKEDLFGEDQNERNGEK